MVSKYTFKKIVWIDLEDSTKEETESIVEEYNLPVVLSSDFAQKEGQFKNYPQAVFFCLPMPKFDPINTEDISHISFAVGENILVTHHNGSITALREVGHLFEEDMIFHENEDNFIHNLLILVIRKLYNDLNKNVLKMRSTVFDPQFRAKISAKKFAIRIKDLYKKLVFIQKTVISHEKNIKFFESSIINEYNEVLDELSSSIAKTDEMIIHANTSVIESDKKQNKLTVILVIIIGVLTVLLLKNIF